MKNLFVCLIAVGFMAAGVRADEGANYAAATAKFAEMKAASEANPDLVQEGARFEVPAGTKFNIAPVQNLVPNKPPYRCGIAVWFQLEDGRFVNPIKHKWQRRERFRIWIEPAVPVTVSLHQNYSDDRPGSRQVYPDIRYPETFRSFPACRPVTLPVSFEMDDDLIDEIMSMVVVRCDAGLLPFNQPTAPAGVTPGATSTSGPGGTFRASAEMLSRFNDSANASGTINGESSRFDIVGPPINTSPEFSQTPADVQFFMFGVGNSHQFQLTLHKD